MSLKVSAFTAALPVPKTVDKFYVILPGSTRSLFTVSAASLPFANRTEGAIWFLGRKLTVPLSEQVDGEWTCTLEEDAAMHGAALISLLERMILDKKCYFGDLIIGVTDQLTGEYPQLTCTLHNAWLKSAKAVSLDWSKPTDKLSYELTFVYSSITRSF